MTPDKSNRSTPAPLGDYPIAPLLPEILASLAATPRLVLEAPPGAGKTTQVPLALLAAPWCTGRILMLEPRRIAARAAATFMAAQLGEQPGETVGYRIRFEAKVSPRTRLEILTEGILTRMLQDSPQLDGIAAVVFDEFHERSLAADLGLALCLDIQAGLRPDLRLMVMSATLDGARLARYLDAPRLTARGRSHPVTTTYVSARAQERLEFQLARAVHTALDETAGDVLCFLPGKAELERAARVLAATRAEVVILHGELGIEEQAQVLAPGAKRRVVLATNVAESSLTLPGITAVVDSGLAREPRFDPASGMSRLALVTITQASATQRAGRAGRLGPGRCYRLWPESQRLEASTRPEIQQVELSAFALELKAWGATDLRFLDAPPPGALAQAHDLLQRLQALDSQGRPTALGRSLLALGLPPRLATLLRRAPTARAGLACDLAALLEARDPMRGAARRNDDLRTRLAALQAWRDRQLERGETDARVIGQIEQNARHWRRRLGAAMTAATAVDAHAVGDLLALAYPDRIAHVDAANPRRYQLANGRGAMLAEDSLLVGEPWLVAAELRFDARDSLILRAAPCDPAEIERLYADDFTVRVTRRFRRESGAVETVEEQRFAELLLAQRSVPTARDADTAAALAAGVMASGVAGLPWTEALREWQARVAFLRLACPELGLPDVSDAALESTREQWLPALTAGKTRLAEITPQAFAQTLHERLDHAQRRALDEHAPLELLVPSGMHRKLSYGAGDAPVLAVKLQELFGLADGPSVARGRVPVVLHLLSPRQAPLQVTRDLRSFWATTYPSIRGSLQGRYPKHPWPLDPWTATATHRAKRRS